MTLQLELTPEEEARSAQAAHARGMDVTRYARLLLGLERPDATRLFVDEWEAALDELSQDVNPALPPLSDEALSRRSIYGHRAWCQITL